jgi:menaquinone-dependent protoporphyrinogen IX oxidase
MHVLIAYYSWQGHTAKVAQALAGQLGAEMVRIEPVAESGMFVKAMKAILGMKSDIRPCRVDLAGMDHLVIASPVWAHKVPPYVNEYLSRVTGGSGKPFSVLVEMGGSGAESAIGVIRRALEKKGMRFVASAFTREEQVNNGTFGDRITILAEAIRKGGTSQVGGR